MGILEASVVVAQDSGGAEVGRRSIDDTFSAVAVGQPGGCVLALARQIAG
jgi:hypothetical protein